jgi:hypothetical protein
MPRRISIYVLMLVILGVFLNHFSVSHKENGWLLLIDGREVDALGMAQENWVKLSRRCGRVTPVAPTSPQHSDIQKLIQAYSPPSSESAQIVRLLTMDDWLLVEVVFKELLPAVVLIDQSKGPPRIIPNAIWSGETHPWLAGPFIRHYLASKAPDAPVQLLQCYDPP